MVPQPEGHGLALLEVAGTCAVICILAHNQREKERVERSLRRSERRFRALVQHASDIIMVVACRRHRLATRARPSRASSATQPAKRSAW